MPAFTVTTDIPAPPDRVWDVMSDVERWHEWTASITRVTRLDDGPMRAGSRARVKQPRLAAGVFEVTSWLPGRSFEWVTRPPGVTGIARHVIEPIPEGSRVTLSVEFRGPLAPLVAWWYGALTRRYLEMEAAGLADCVRRARGDDLTPFSGTPGAGAAGPSAGSSASAPR